MELQKNSVFFFSLLITQYLFVLFKNKKIFFITKIVFFISFLFFFIFFLFFFIFFLFFFIFFYFFVVFANCHDFKTPNEKKKNKKN